MVDGIGVVRNVVLRVMRDWSGKRWFDGVKLVGCRFFNLWWK